MIKKQIILLAIGSIFSANIFGQYLDPSFGTDGVVYFPNEESIKTVLGLPDGKVLALGDSTLYGLNVDGTTDTAFGNNGMVDVGCSTTYMRLMPDNTHLVMFTDCVWGNVKVFDTSGNLVNEMSISSCHQNLSPVAPDRIRVMNCGGTIRDQNIFNDGDFFTFSDQFPTVSQGERAVVMSGVEDYTITMGAIPNMSWDPMTLHINKIEDDGLATEWVYSEVFAGDADFIAPRLNIYGAYAQSDNKIVYNYGYTGYYAADRHIRRLNADGSVDDTFNNLLFPKVEAACDCLKPAAMTLTPDDEIILAFNSSGFSIGSAMKRYDKDGSLKFSYEAPIIGGGFHAEDIFVQPDNSVFLSVKEFISIYSTDNSVGLVAKFEAPACFSEGIVFTTQTQIDSFVINYPGCTRISGDVTIEGNQITNLNGLAQITSIGGDLRIMNNSALPNFAGLDNLAGVGGELYLYNNDAVTNLNDFASLSLVGNTTDKGISIEANDNLINLEGLEGITSLPVLQIQNNTILNSLLELANLTAVENLTITDNPSLTTLAGLEGITSLNLLDLRNNDALTTLTGLDNVTSIEELIIYNHDGLINLNGLNNLNTVNDYMSISGNSALNSLLELENLTWVADLIISDNNSLTTLTGFEEVTSMESVSIESNDNLLNLNGLDNLTWIKYDLKVQHNSSLPSLAGLSNLDSLGQLLIRNNSSLSTLDGINNLIQTSSIVSIQDNQNLTGLNGLENLNSTGFYLKIENNNSLVSLNGLQNLNTVGGNLNIEGNDALVSLDGLQNLSTTGWYLTIEDNDNLISLTGLNGLISTNGGLNIIGNQVLNDITALQNLTSIAGSMRIYQNDVLPSLSGLNNVDEIINYLRISENPMLNFCSIGSVCNYITDPSSSHIIHSNAANCSEAEIPPLCLLSVELIDFQATIENKAALLTWKTATETNNAGFEIQRSKDGINWEKIAWQDGQGTTTNTHTYTYRDRNPLFGTSYYRLKQVDFDGAFEHTHVVQVNYEGRDISIYPNPVENTLHIANLNGEDIQHISIYDQTGKEILLQMMPNNTIDVSALSPGMYILKIGMKDEVFCKKFIVQEMK